MCPTYQEIFKYKKKVVENKVGKERKSKGKGVRVLRITITGKQ